MDDESDWERDAARPCLLTALYAMRTFAHDRSIAAIVLAALLSNVVRFGGRPTPA